MLYFLVDFQVTDSQTNITVLLNELGIETYKQYDEGKHVLEVNGKTLTYKSSIPSISVPSLIDLQLNVMKINRISGDINTLDPFIDTEKARALETTNIQQFLLKSSFSKTAQSTIYIALRNLCGLEPSEINTLFAMFFTKSGGGSIESLIDSCKGCAQEKRIKGNFEVF